MFSPDHGGKKQYTNKYSTKFNIINNGNFDYSSPKHYKTDGKTMIRKQEIDYPFYGNEGELTEEQQKFLREFHFRKQKLFETDCPE